MEDTDKKQPFSSFMKMKSDIDPFTVQLNSVKQGRDRADSSSNYSDASKSLKIKNGHMMKCFDSIFGGKRLMRSTIKKDEAYNTN